MRGISLSLLLLLSFHPIESSAQEILYLQTWGIPWSPVDGGLVHPHAFASDGHGGIYVVDTGQGRIQKFDLNGNFIFKWGSVGSGDGQFRQPTGIAINSLGEIFVADDHNFRVQKFDSAGNFISKWGSEGSGNNQFWGLRDIAVDAYDNVYVAGFFEIKKFDSAGNFILKWGGQGSGSGQFLGIQSIAISPSSDVYVADPVNLRIQVFDDVGSFAQEWQTPVDGLPYGLGIDAIGNVYAADFENHLVRKYDRIGNLLFQWGEPGNGEYQLWGPTDVVVDESGDIHVLELANSQAKKYQELSKALCKSYPDNTVWFGGTTWDLADARWEAISDGTWAFESGVGSHFNHSEAHVDPAKNPGLHAYMEGWIGVDNSSSGEWSDIKAISDLPSPLTSQTCSINDSVLVFSDNSGGHSGTKDNFASSPWIDLDPADQGKSGRVIIFDGYFESPALEYIYPAVYVQYSTGGSPTPWLTTPSVFKPGSANCSEAGAPFSIDVSSLIPAAATEIRIGLGVKNHCSSYPGTCTGLSNSTPWFDNVRFGIYDNGVFDDDGDGVPTAEELGAPNSGDGNNDSTLDAIQNNVASFLDESGLGYITLEVPPGGGPADGLSFGCAAMRPLSELPPPPGGVNFPCGIFDFSFSGFTGNSVTMTVTLPSGCIPAGQYWKYGPEPGNPDPHWYYFGFDIFTQTGALFGPGTVTLFLKDGLRGDDDLVANGVITDAGGAAISTLGVDGNLTPKVTSLSASPNPLRRSSVIQFNNVEESRVSVNILDVSGRLVRTLIDETLQPGSKRFEWDAREDSGKLVSAGVYFVRVRAKNTEMAAKLVVVP